MHLFSSKPALMLMAAAAGLMVAACGDKSTDNVDNSEITEMNAAGMMEGTTNDASAMDMATDTNIATGNTNAMDNAMDAAGNASTNMAEDNAAN